MLAAWPASIPLVIEAHHPTWHVDETFAALRAAGVTNPIVSYPTGADEKTVERFIRGIVA